MFDTWFESREREIAGWLHDLHRHPELGFEEKRTAAFVASQLRDLGLEVTTGIGGTGVVGVLRKGRTKGTHVRAIGLRAELDALPIREQAAITYRSEVDGVSHACGHDGHAVTLLTAAAYLARRDDLEGTVVFIFQPAEELLEGARAMLADGLFERFPCDEIYALHNIPGMPRGHVGVVNGGALASSDDVAVVIHATGTHGSAPHTGSDGVLAAAAFLTALQQSVTRVIDSRDSGVISFGRITGGSAGNVLPDRVEMAGTMRTHAPQVRKRLVALIEQVARGVEVMHGVRVNVKVESKVPVTMNHPLGVDAVLASAARVVGRERTVGAVRPVMASEDFSLLLEKVPGAYFFVGQDGPYCHDPNYVFDPAVIPVGAAMLADIALSRCAVIASPSPAAHRNAKSQSSKKSGRDRT